MVTLLFFPQSLAQGSDGALHRGSLFMRACVVWAVDDTFKLVDVPVGGLQRLKRLPQQGFVALHLFA